MGMLSLWWFVWIGPRAPPWFLLQRVPQSLLCAVCYNNKAIQSALSIFHFLPTSLELELNARRLIYIAPTQRVQYFGPDTRCQAVETGIRSVSFNLWWNRLPVEDLPWGFWHLENSLETALGVETRNIVLVPGTTNPQMRGNVFILLNAMSK